MMDFEKRLYKKYQLLGDSLRDLVKLEGEYPFFNFEIHKEGDVLKYRAKLKINDFVEIMSNNIYIDKNKAKNDCSQNALEYIDRIISNHEFYESFKYFLIFSIILFGFCGILYLTFYQNIMYSVVLLIFCIFISPFFIQNMEIGTIVGMDVYVRRTCTIENIYYNKGKSVTNGDIVLINKIATPTEYKSDFYFEATTKKELILHPKDKDFPLYKILPNNAIRINIDRDTNGNITHSLRIVTYEIDGQPRNYFLNDIPIDHYSTDEDLERYIIFSRYGNHVIRTRYVERSFLKSFPWYLAVLSIYYDYIITIFENNEYNNKCNMVYGQIINNNNNQNNKNNINKNHNNNDYINNYNNVNIIVSQ